MSIKLVEQASKVKVGNSVAKSILMYLALRYNDSNGQCNPSQETIAADLEINRTTVTRWITFLEANNFISRTPIKEKGRFRSFNYSLPCCSVQHGKSNSCSLQHGETDTNKATVALTNTVSVAHRVEENRVEQSNTISTRGSTLKGTDKNNTSLFEIEKTLLTTKGLITPHNKIEWGESLQFANESGLDTKTRLADYLMYLETDESFSWRKSPIDPKFFCTRIIGFLKKPPPETITFKTSEQRKAEVAALMSEPLNFIIPQTMNGLSKRIEVTQNA